MTLLRSIVFQILFYCNLIAQMIVFSPVFFICSDATAWKIVKNWARSSLWLLRYVAGTRSWLTGQENIPEGPVIIASKHQSFWEIIALLPQISQPTFILKKELMAIPIFGQYAKRMKMIPVDRAKRGGAIASMQEGARQAIADGRQIVIFPEGTRAAPGSAPDYRQGVFRLYDALQVPVVPVALNSGLYWPRKAIIRKPGTIHAVFLPAIAPGLERAAFIESLRGQIEEATSDLLAEAFSRDGYAPSRSQTALSS